MPPMKRGDTIALTGGTGFLGRHLLKALLKEGYNVRALVRTPSSLDIKHPKLSVFQGDLESDLRPWAEGADCVIHLAGLVKAKTWAEYETVNVHGAKNIAEAAQSADVARFILMSSMTARAPDLSFYAKSKKLGEDAVSKAFSGNLAVIRAPAVFGPGDMATKPIFDLMARGLLPAAGGKNWRNRSVAMVYAEDLVADLVSRGLSGDYDGQCVSPSTIGALTMPEFAKFGSQALGKTVRSFAIPTPIIYPVAVITTVTLRLFSLGHLSLGKLAEFRYEHWQSNELVANPTPMVEAIAKTVNSYKRSG